MRSKSKWLWVAVWATVMATALQASAASISMNFVENATNQILTGGTPIGPISVDGKYWNDNSKVGTPWATNSMSNLIDDTGAATGVNVSWRSSNTWYTGEGTGSDEAKLSVGYLDDGTTTSPYGVQVTFTNIPYIRYRVYGMYASDTNQNTSPYIVTMRNFEVNGVWVLGGTDATTAQAYGRTDRNYTANGQYWTKIEPGVKVGNYWTIETSGSTLTIKGLPRNGSQRGSLTGVIIEEIDKFLAYNPTPAVGTEVPLNQVLSWQQVPEVSGLGVTYKVYFGTDPNVLSPNYYGNQLVKTTTSDPADFFYAPALNNSTKYYWRVDAIEPNLPNPIVHTGQDWWFTTQPPSPRIETNPVSQTVPAGTDVQLSVSGINITSYQWYKDGAALPPAPALYAGEQTSTLTIFDVQVADEGFYYCVGDNSLNQPSTSAAAQVLTERLVGWWRLDGDLTDSVDEVIAGAAAHDGVSTDPNFVLGKDGSALQFFGGADDIVTINNSVEFFNFYPRGYTVSAWVNMPEKFGGNWGAFVSKQQREDGADWKGFILTHQTSGQAVHTLRQSFNDLGSGTDVDDNNWHMVTGTYDAATKVGKIYVDGVLKGQATNPATVQTNPRALIFGEEVSTSTISPYTGLLDDVRIWSYAVDPVTIATLYTDFNPGAEVCVEHPEYDVAGPDGIGNEFRDCRVNLYDFVPFANTWLDCNIVPTCIP
ncbi:MAG TPA: immunoglobulin domain-containing protein [Anaerohalosphaeraceae bacterium]|nr:immunoglobulin domain-containing protein [Anaerohalosphaeraceae bacterium]HOL31187.1 immunoglobulin domain-containing protein [Anaerohalosphaeraceae bacterium]HPO70264.1 immunoglobulin domain-containing protein [Anaerohalosphaeraceae bacterium]